MRIVQVAPFFHPHAGGVESHVRAIAREFARRGHEVTVLTSQFRPELAETESFEGYRIVRGRTLGVWFNTPVDPGVGDWIDRVPADIIHLHFPPPFTSWFSARRLRRLGVPSCLTYHCDLYLATRAGAGITELYNRFALPPTLDAVDRIVVHTRSYAVTSRGLRGRPVEVIPSSVDLDRFRPDVDGSAVRERLGLAGRRVIAFTGRLVPHKGVDDLLRALARLPADVVLLVIGRGPDLPSLTALAQRLGVLDRVRFCPAVSDEDLPRYLRAADLFVFPSQNRLEGFGLAVAEALASGLPVVITDIPGVREVIEPGREGILAEPLLENDLADRVRELLDDPDRRARMARAARDRAERYFGVVTVTDSLLELYRRLRAAD
ncbi:MAG TPA: glycosyltransferase family 4 protein [Thermoplasmata archaeon]|nr:glycosyltransferase family 4 protein [Thermoplasmata archaeon]